MYVIGITGGVGAGKSSVLSLLQDKTKCVILKADDIANEIKKKGNICFDKIVNVIGEDCIGADGEIDKEYMAMIIFSDSNKKSKVEAIIHPAVKRYIVDSIAAARREGNVKYVFVEAALLIEAGYMAICDEIWYVYASVATRVKRLMESRGYSINKVESIMDTQMKDKDFRKYCQYVIDNDGDMEKTIEDIDHILGN